MTNEFHQLKEFVDLAEKNRKYTSNTAHGRRAALKLFDTVLHDDERNSLDLIQERMGEIYLALISKHKDTFSMQSLNTYKGRFLKVIQEYKKYGVNPNTIITWEVKNRPYTKQLSHLVSVDQSDQKDTSFHSLSFGVHKGVHKLQIALESGEICVIEAPMEITAKDITRIKNVIEALGK